MDPELGPGEDLEKFIEGSETSGQGNERIRLLGHQGFAFVHRFHFHQPAQPLVRHFHSGQRAGNDADDLASVSQCGVCQSAHQAHLRTAIHQAQPGLSQEAPQSYRLSTILRPHPRTRSTKDANPAPVFLSFTLHTKIATHL